MIVKTFTDLRQDFVDCYYDFLYELKDNDDKVVRKCLVDTITMIAALDPEKSNERLKLTMHKYTILGQIALRHKEQKISVYDAFERLKKPGSVRTL